MIENDDWLKISYDLEQYHVIFYKLWGMGKPVFTESIPTAAVYFNKEGEYLEFKFNPKFWDSLSHYERLFVISHECLHIVLRHGQRGINCENQQLANIAMDICVNHLLVNGFGFNRQALKDNDKICWVDTIFPNKNVPDNESFEYYYNLLNNNPPQKIQEPLDSHSGIGIESEKIDSISKGSSDGDDSSSENSSDKNDKLGDPKDFDKPLQDLNDFLTNEDKQDFLNKTTHDLKPGTGSFGSWVQMKVKVKYKKKWETVIKKWSKKYLSDDVLVDQWVKKNRRYTMLSSNLLLPSEEESDHVEKNRITVWFFQDCSGSCAHLAQRFFKASRTLDPRRFDIKLFYFDTRVIPTTFKENNVYYGGGTSFTCIERYIQDEIKKQDIPYPECCYLITDGYGDYVKPQYPERWHWFLSTSYRSCIPTECNVYDLKDFE